MAVWEHYAVEAAVEILLDIRAVQHRYAYQRAEPGGIAQERHIGDFFRIPCAVLVVDNDVIHAARLEHGDDVERVDAVYHRAYEPFAVLQALFEIG